ALAAPRLADDAERLVDADVEADRVDRVHRPVVGAERNRQVTHLEQRAGPLLGQFPRFELERRGRVAHQCFACGSKASRNPSPKKFTHSTVRRIIRPGKYSRWVFWL